MKTLCYSVRVKSLTEVGKAYKVISFDGSEDFIPQSQVFGQDYEISKSKAYWLSAWILGKKTIQYSEKKKGWFDGETRNRLPTYTVKKHIPDKIHKKPTYENELER